VIVDALDTVKDRLTLEAVAKSMGVPFVHGALAGFEGQLITVYPRISGSNRSMEAVMKAAAQPTGLSSFWACRQ